MERTSPSHRFPLGSELPQFKLPATDGSKVDGTYFRGAKASLIAFTCNHCPYVKGSEHLLVELARKYQGLGLKVVTINSNDPQKYPDDSFEKMREKSKEMDLPYPYLFDESQNVARRFDAQCTPEFYLFNSELVLVYHGAINDSPRDSSKVSRHYLLDAIQSVVEGKSLGTDFAHPIGCSIKWK
jgi:peroxiredoxin